MKSKELIRLIQEEDPSGELECCVGNIDIFYVEKLPVYYDGYLQKLIRDDSKKPYYDVVGASYGGGESSKINIRTLSIEDAIDNNDKLPIDYSRLNPSTAERYKANDDRNREMIRKIELDIEKSYFHKWLEKKIGKEKWSREETDKLYDSLGLKRDDPLAKDEPKTDDKGYTWHNSYVDRRFKSWDNTLDLDIGDNGEPVIFRKHVPNEETSES